MIDMFWFCQVFVGFMGNCFYFVGDLVMKKVFVVDLVWDLLGILCLVQEDGYEVIYVVLIYVYQDYVGGEIVGQKILGFVELFDDVKLLIYIYVVEVNQVVKVMGIFRDVLMIYVDDEVFEFDGLFNVRILYMFGYFLGSCGFFVGDYFICGDMFFV